MNKSGGFLLLLVLFPCYAFTQHQISKYEKMWAVAHPIAAFKIKKKLPHAMSIYHEVRKSKILDTLENGGKLDAFRHTYTMAFLSKSIKVSKLRKLGVAHEKGNKWQYFKKELEFGERPDSLSCDMDLKNNELGFEIGTQNPQMIEEELKTTVIKVIQEGKAWYLKRNENYQYVDCEGKTLNLLDYSAKWAIPKCLIPTNQ